MRNSLSCLKFLSTFAQNISRFFSAIRYFLTLSLVLLFPRRIFKFPNSGIPPNDLGMALCKSSYVVSRRSRSYSCMLSKVHAEPSRHSWIPPSSLPLAATSPIEDIISSEKPNRSTFSLSHKLLNNYISLYFFAMLSDFETISVF
jgi:hypothetical protein